MLSQHTHTLAVPTHGREFHDITGEVESLLDEAGFAEGLATVHL